MKDDCGAAKIIKIIGSKWTLNILHELFNGQKRFGQLQQSLNGISPKTLSHRLKELEIAGIISKTVFAEVPLHVEYNLTTKGQSLDKLIKALDECGEKL